MELRRKSAASPCACFSLQHPSRVDFTMGSPHTRLWFTSAKTTKTTILSGSLKPFENKNQR